MQVRARAGLEEGEAQAERGDLDHGEQTLDVQPHREGLLAVDELELPAEERVEARPLHPGPRIRVQAPDEADEVLGHVAGAVRVKEVTAVALDAMRVRIAFRQRQGV